MKRIVIVFYIVVVAVLAATTIVEKYLGTEYVSEHIFGAWWFSAMWAVLTAVATFYFIKRKVRRASVVVITCPHPIYANDKRNEKILWLAFFLLPLRR